MQSVAALPDLFTSSVHLADDAESAAEPSSACARLARQNAQFETLYRKYSRRAYTLAWGFLKDEEEALDAVQEAFIRAHRALARFEGRSSHYSWLYRIVVNVCIDRCRKRRRWGCEVEFDEPQLDSGRETPFCAANDPERAYESGRIRTAVLASLDRLSEPHRTAIVLREFEGMTYTEIAQATGCKRGTIMSRLFHARRKMRDLLRDALDGETPEAA